MVWQLWKLCMASGVGGGHGRWSGRGCGSGSWHGSHGRQPWTLNKSTKLLRAAKMVAGFEGPAPPEEEEEKKIALGIRGPSCLLK